MSSISRSCTGTLGRYNIFAQVGGPPKCASGRVWEKVIMSESLFEVVFQGKLVDGFSVTDVKANVARLFKATPQQIEHMFVGKRVVIRNQLDQETALKYQVLLRKNGAVCQVEPMQSAAAPAPAAPASATPQASPQAAATRPAATPAPAPAARPATFAQPATASGASAPMPGRLPVAGKKVDSILSGTDLSLAPNDAGLAGGTGAVQAKAPDVSHLSLAPVGVRLGDEQELPPPIVPDVDHFSLAPPGARLSDPQPDE